MTSAHYIWHPEAGATVLMPERTVLMDYGPHEAIAVCSPCSLRYRREHGERLDPAGLTLLANPPTDTELALRAHEEMAERFEKTNRYEPQGNRTVAHMLTADLKLFVAMLYKPKWEQLVGFGNKAALEKYDVKAHLAYALSTPHGMVGLSRGQALEALETGAAPAGVTLPSPRPPPDPEEMERLFTLLGGPNPSGLK